MTKGFKKDGKFRPTEKRMKSALSMSDMKGYNVKTKQMETIRNAKRVTLKNGRPAVKGVGTDGTPIFKILPSK